MAPTKKTQGAESAVARLGRRVRELRERAGMTQDQLGQAAGIDGADLSRIERGIGPTNIGVERVERLAKALGVRPGVLLDP